MSDLAGRDPPSTHRDRADARWRARLLAESGLLGLLVGVAVVWPWTHGGYLLLLDWVSGPQQTVNPGVFGLAAGSLDAMPFRILTQVLRGAFGSQATAWILVLAFFPLAASGVSALAGGGRARRHVAALVMVANPFVLERLHAGHVAFLLVVGLLPWLAASAVHARRLDKRFAVRPAGWFALATAISPHAAFLGGTILLAVAVLPRPTVRDLVRTAGIVASAAVVYGYAAVVALTGVRTIEVTQADLEAYATLPGPGGLLPTVLSLHGFWRGSTGGTRLPRDVVGPVVGALLLALVVALVALGLSRLVRRDVVLGAPLAAVTVVGLLLGAGVNGPVGGLYRMAFDHLPLFATMREQEKWLSLSAIGYAVALGVVAELATSRLRGGAKQPGRLLAVGATCVAALAVPLVTAPVLLWGLGGSVQVSRYPQSWYSADRQMGNGLAGVLFLPWHGYQPFSFTGGRTVATPGEAFFRRPVLSSDAVELAARRTDSVSRRTAYLDEVVADAGRGELGPLLAPLGIGWVVVAKDGSDPAPWVRGQRGILAISSSPTLDLYRVVPNDLSARMARDGATAFTLSAGRPGEVLVPVEWSAGWRLDGRQGTPTPAGTLTMQAGPAAAAVVYAPWRWLLPASVLSLLALAGLLVAGLVEHRHDLARLLPLRRRRTPHS